MTSRRLHDILVRYLLTFAAAAGMAALGLAALVAYAVEDRFIDEQLRTTAASVRSGIGDGELLPPGFVLFRDATLPIDIGAEFVSPRDGDIREFRRPDGAYVHVLVIGEGAARRYLLHDVSDALVVGPNMVRAALTGLACLAVFLMIAALVARRLGRRVESEGERLLAELGECRSPGDVRDLAGRQSIREMHAFLSVHADIWEQRTKALREQQELVDFLAHELRTPLQSARTSLAVIRDKLPGGGAMERLDRALSRLTRASHAALFLAAKSVPDTQEPVSIFALWNELRTEMAPLAEHRGLTLASASGIDPMPMAPRVAVEPILSNLLANAVQHGAPGSIELHGERDSFAVKNEMAADVSPGFGLGLSIVRRLCARLGWDVAAREEDDTFKAKVILPGSDRE